MTVDLIKIGIDGIDNIFLGGVPKNNVILITGEIGSGKTLFGTEYIYRGITEFNEPGIIVSFEANPQKMMRDMAAFGWHLANLEAQDRLKIIFTSPEVLDQELRTPDSLLLETIHRIGAKRIFIDSITQLRPAPRNDNGNSYGQISFREHLREFIEGLMRENLTPLMSHELGTQAEWIATQEVAELVADTVITLRRSASDRGIYRVIEIKKSRGHGFEAGEHTMRIKTGKGLEVFRRVQAELESITPQPTSSARHTVIGSEPLDTLIGDGLLEGSITILTGVSGIGKSILGYQLLESGASKLGKPGLHVTLDEHPQQVLRNAGILGIDLQGQIDAGRVHLLHDSPLELQVDIHFNYITRIARQHKIERMVIDGLTTYRNAINDQKRFREFVHGLIAFSKAHLITTFISYENPEMFGMTRYMPDGNVSSIVDNVILLSFVELGNEIRRAITVIKARGSNHSFITHEFKIGQGGISLIESQEKPSAALSFRNYYGLISRAPTRLKQDPISNDLEEE